MSKVIMFLADGFEEVEGLTAVDLLRRGGVEVDMASITGNREITSSHNVHIIADILAEDADMDKYDMLVLPGGMPGTNHLKASKLVADTAKDFVKKDKYIAAICAAPTVFGELGLLEGKKACCYGGMEAGLVGAQVSYDNVSVDGKIITSRGLGTAIEFGLTLLAIFNGEEAAKQMAEKIMLK